MTRALRFFKVSSRERSVLLSSFVWVVVYRVGLWVVPFSLARRWTWDYSSPMDDSGDDSVVVEIVRAVRLASEYVPYASCLTQALAARKLLSHYGHDAELKIGVTKNDGNFEAHAWLEVDGRIVLGKQRVHSRYVVLDRKVEG